MEITTFTPAHPITSQHSPASSRQLEVCACMPHLTTKVKHKENSMFSFMPLQAYKKNRSRLESIGVRMLQEHAKTHGNINIPHRHPIASQQHSPTSSRQPELCACMPHLKTVLKIHRKHMISCMPFQAHKKNRARL